MSSKFFESFSDLFSGSSSVGVLVNVIESLSSIFVTEITAMLISLSFFSKVAESVVFEDSVGKFPEFNLVDLTWLFSINLSTSLLSPFPVSISNGVVL